MRSAIRFLDATGRMVDSLVGTETLASSAGLPWQGVDVEMGRNQCWEADDLRPDAHYIGLNVGRARLSWEARIDGRFRTVGSDPGGCWFCPAGEVFSHRVATPAEFVLIRIAPARFAAWTDNRPVALVRSYGIESTQIDLLSRALIVEARAGGPNGPLFVDALTQAMSLALATVLGLNRTPANRSGMLAPERLRRVLEFIECHLATPPNIHQLAAVAAYSPAHFARAFKAATGVPPHRYVLNRRLARAGEALRRGLAPVQVAADLGFADQAHFTHAFRQAFQLTPAAVRGAIFQPLVEALAGEGITSLAAIATTSNERGMPTPRGRR